MTQTATFKTNTYNIIMKNGNGKVSMFSFETIAEGNIFLEGYFETSKNSTVIFSGFIHELNTIGI